jgi:predicted nucleotidyltransferase
MTMAVNDKTPATATASPSISPGTASLLGILRTHLPALATQYRIKSLGLFGSYVRNEQKPTSDLDILVEFKEAPSLFEFIRLEHQLSDLLGVKVDLVMKDSLKPAIGKRILQEVVPV